MFLYNSQHGRIIRAFQNNKNKPLNTAFFQKSYRYFVGWRFSARICELMKKGIAERAGDDGRFALYRLTEEGMKYELKKESWIGRMFWNKSKNNLFN